MLSYALRAAPETNSGDVLRFVDGAVLHGAFKGMDPNRGLRWLHPDAKSPFDLQPAHVDFIRFTQASSVSVSPNCHFRFADGDDLFGTLVSLDAQSADLTTWFGGKFRVPRSALQSITFLPTNYSVLYQGPTAASEWTVGEQAGGRTIVRGVNGQMMNVQIAGGAVLNINGRQITSNPGAPPPWTFRDGGFAGTGVGTLGRDFHLSGSSTIEFDLTPPSQTPNSSGQFYLLLALYSPTDGQIYNIGGGGLGEGIILGMVQEGLKDGEIPNGPSSFILQLNNVRANYQTAADHSGNLGSVTLPVQSPGNPPAKTRITIHCNKQEGVITLLADGVEVKRWNDVGSFSRLGGSVVFQGQGGSVTISNVKVSQWQGRFEPDIAPAPAPDADAVSFINHDTASGIVGGITDGRLDFQIDGQNAHVPIARISQVAFARSGADPEPRGPWEVRAVFPGGGSISFQLDKWDDATVTGHSALFGSLSFPPGAIQEMLFNLDRPRTQSMPAPVNYYDALDQ